MCVFYRNLVYMLFWLTQINEFVELQSQVKFLWVCLRKIFMSKCTPPKILGGVQLHLLNFGKQQFGGFPVGGTTLGVTHMCSNTF